MERRAIAIAWLVVGTFVADPVAASMEPANAVSRAEVEGAESSEADVEGGESGSGSGSGAGLVEDVYENGDPRVAAPVPEAAATAPAAPSAPKAVAEPAKAQPRDEWIDPIQATIGSCMTGLSPLAPALLHASLCPRLTGILDPARNVGGPVLPTRDPSPEDVGPFRMKIAGVWVEAESRHVPWMPVVARVGMIPTPTLSAVNAAWRRMAGPGGAEAAGLLGGMGLGAGLGVEMPARLGELAVAVFHPNGFLTGGSQPGHLAGVRLSLAPLDPFVRMERSPIRVFASSEDAAIGSVQRGRRWSVGASLDHRLATIGGERTTAVGVGADATREAEAWGGFVTLRPHARLDGFVRYDLVDRVAPTRARLVTAGIGIRGPAIKRLVDGLDLQATYQRVQGTVAVLGGPPPDALTTQSAVRFHLNVRF